MPVPEPASSAAAQAGGWLLAERYRVLDRIGSGGMAEVFRARDELLAREVAVKVFRRELDPANSAGGLQRQEIELQVLAQLSHPNLITLFDGRLAEKDGENEHAYLVMELINGPSLAARLADGPLPEAEVRAIAIQICHALGYVHGKGMVHRDVKPANILLGSDEVGEPGQVDGAGQVVLPAAGLRARLSDFGIVRLLDSAHLTSVDFMVGTASYLAPEQARGTEVGPPADIYALGLVLLEALTGERTFPGPPMASVMARLDGPPPIPDTLPAPWPGLLAAMTATDPASRPSAAQVAATLSAEAAPVGLLAAADNTVRLAAVPVGAELLDASRTQTLPAVVDEPDPVPPAPVAGSHRRGAGWLPWLLALLILVTATVVAYLIYHALQADSGTPGPSNPTTGHSSAAPRTTSRHSTASTAASTGTTASRPVTSATSTSAPPTTAATTSAPPTSSPPSSASTPASNPATGTASSTAAAGTSAAPASHSAPASSSAPNGSPSATR